MKDVQMLQVRAYEYLKKLIINGELTEGILYSQKKLAEGLGISKTPFRDAVMRLEQERYIDVYPSKGFVVHEMTGDDIEETYQIRSAIETYCLRQLCLHREEERAQEYVRKLFTKVEAMEEIASGGGSYEEFARKDYEFHRSIVQYVGNEAMLEIYRDFMHRIFKQNVLSFTRPGRMQDTLQEHRHIMRALEKGEKETLEQLLEEHMQTAKQINLKLLGKEAL